MTAALTPYLGLRPHTREAMEFYASIFGGTLTMSTFGESGMPGDDPDAVMHAQLEVSATFTLMASDFGSDPATGANPPHRDHLALVGGADDADQLSAWFQAIVDSDGSTPIVPLAQAPWGGQFGQAEDRFGITWMVNIGPA